MMCEMQIRVRGAESDATGCLHHARYLVYFEEGRTELARQRGLSYRDMEDRGYLMVIIRAQVCYHQPALPDDLLMLRTTVARTTLFKLEHHYELFRDGVLLAEGDTTVACIDREGKIQPLPDCLQVESDNGPAM
jgi:acyl-CoA thioester hydrolase